MAMHFLPPPPGTASTAAEDISGEHDRTEKPATDSRRSGEPTSSTMKDDFSDRGHIVTIPRPPEWDTEGNDSDDESEYSTGYDTGDESDEAAISGEDAVARPAGATPERGVMLSFPFLELHSIELLELTTLNMTVRCLRCKDTTDVEKLKNNATGDYAGMRTVSCKKCVTPLEIGRCCPHVSDAAITDQTQVTGWTLCTPIPFAPDIWISMDVRSWIFCRGE